VSFGDFDNDGYLDLYITVIYIIDTITGDQKHNVLYRNDSVGDVLSFTDVAVEAGVDFGGWGWGTTFVDIDNDGWLDIAETNGWFAGEWETDTSKLFMNPGQAPFVFTDRATETGFADTRWGAALVAFDYDRDGDLDVGQACIDTYAHLLNNQPVGESAQNRYLTVKPRMLGPNHRALGAVVRVTVGERQMMRLITAGTSSLGQEPAEALFGLGGVNLVDSVAIEWPDGTRTVLTDVSTNQVLTVTHGGFGDLDADSDVDVNDYELFAECVTGPGNGAIIYGTGCRASDIDADGDVDIADFAAFTRNFSMP
jgi:hypothetical protein